jgi:hypothetical protein
LAKDKQFLNEMTIECATQKTAYEERKKGREEEVAALVESSLMLKDITY